MNSVVRPGYKMTALGIIPQEWSTTTLGSLGDLTSSKRIFESDYSPSGIPFFRGKEISLLIEGKSIEDSYFITEDKYNEIKSKFGAPEKGDILITAVGTLANIFIVGNEVPFYFKDGNLIWLRKIKEAIPDYIGVQLKANKKAIINGAIGSSQKALTIIVLRNLCIPYPPTNEQRSIAAALSDMDALISGLDQLIAKKRDIKQATMQQLLTGKKRLPGFSGEWTTKSLESISSFITKGSTPTTYGFSWETSGVLFLRSECVSESGLDLSQSMFISLSAHNVLRRSEVCQGDLLITITGNVGRVIILSEEFPAANINQHIAKVRITSSEVDRHFVYQYLSLPDVRREYNSITTGQAYPQLSLKQVRETLIQLPMLQEQTAIATILSDMDAELATLETRRDKAKQLKQGMMQELLTGRIRLL